MAVLNFRLDITSTLAIPSNEPDRLALIRALAEVHQATPLVRFRMKTDVDPAPPGFAAVTWHFEHVDGRVWDEVHTFVDPYDGSEPGMSGVFGTSSTIYFKISEVARLRPIRDLTFRMTPAYGITDLHARWT